MGDKGKENANYCSIIGCILGVVSKYRIGCGCRNPKFGETPVACHQLGPGNFKSCKLLTPTEALTLNP